MFKKLLVAIVAVAATTFAFADETTPAAPVAPSSVVSTDAPAQAPAAVDKKAEKKAGKKEGAHKKAANAKKKHGNTKTKGAKGTKETVETTNSQEPTAPVKAEAPATTPATA